MVILADTREQKRLEFDFPFVDRVEVTTLKTGDYMCQFNDGYIPPLAFERKSISDLFGTMGKGYERFKKEMIRSQEDKVTLILIIEGSLSKVLKGYPRSQLEGKSIVKKLFTLMIRHNIPFICTKDRDEMSRYIYETFCCLGREHIRRTKCTV